jgi:NADH:ubiquinone oxidoreductase subunit 6 (subunit J)
MLVLTIIGWATVWFLVGFAFLAVTGIWSLIDFIMAIIGSMKDKDGKPITKW